MRKLLLLGALAFFAFTASAQSDAPACTEKAKTENVCAKTGEKCSETCANKKTETCCEGKKDGDKKACCSKDGDKKGCSKDGEKKACCSKDADKKGCSKDGDKKSCSKTCTTSEEKAPANSEKTKGAKRTKTKAVGMSK